MNVKLCIQRVIELILIHSKLEFNWGIKPSNMSSYPTFLTLKSWRTKSNEKIKGSIYGHPHHKDGTRINVTPASPISNENLPEQYLLTTLGNHNYWLGKAESAKSHEEQITKFSASLYAKEDRATARHVKLFFQKWQLWWHLPPPQ